MSGTYDSGTELAYEVKEALSWVTAAHILGMVDEPLRLAILHPGNGMYDCLSLVDPDGRPRILMNRNGGSALTDGDLVTGIWDTCRRPGGPEILARQLVARTDLATLDTGAFGPLGTTALRIGRWLGVNPGTKRCARACWKDAAGYTPKRDEELLNQFKVPDSWRLQRDPLPRTDWSAWLFALTDGDRAAALVNTGDGCAVAVEGEPWVDWPTSDGAVAGPAPLSGMP